MERKAVIFPTRLPVKLNKQLRRQAETEDLPAGTIVRRALKAYLKQASKQVEAEVDHGQPSPAA